ncbi:DNA-directed DNA/RNA polymerase mu isoform X2 [Girardinichthys multiradiatus]|nr:DNA-directed DNA/RNA polymerase mu isoform X2 [Girardinichthys multiradiatus]
MWLESQRRRQAKLHLLDVSWYTESMRDGFPVEILDRHKLQDLVVNDLEVIPFSLPSYACQRRTTLENHNTLLTDALSLLAENAELSNEDGRGVAFRRAAAVLKALPSAVTDLSQLTGLPCLGEHSLRVIKDILKNGASSEVQSTKESERFKALKVFTGIFGVGSKTADRWIREGIHNLQQLRDSGHTLNRAQQAGLEHYDDINQPVSMAEADAIRETVGGAVASVLPGAQIVLTGGFRRGKLTGHDVDFLITHPEEGCEVGLMPKLVSWLDSRGLILYQKTTRNSYLESKDGPGRPPANIDRFERCLAIFKLEVQSEKHVKSQSGELCQHLQTEAVAERRWRAVRVDLVVSPVSQFAFALLGWTGSKLFERELRRWAGHERSMSLSSHALYDNKQGRYIRAFSEEEIFAHLGLEYIPPSERNA